MLFDAVKMVTRYPDSEDLLLFFSKTIEFIKNSSNEFTRDLPAVQAIFRILLADLTDDNLDELG